MAKVTLNVVGLLRSYLGSSSIVVQVEGILNFRDLLKRVAEQIGRDLSPLIYDQETGEILKMVAIFVNQENLHQLQGLETPLADGDEVLIMRADMAGG